MILIRTIQNGIGPVEVQKPKARDRAAPAAGERIRFTSAILPKWARRTKSLDLPLILWTPDQAAWRSACSGVIYPRAECSR